MIKHSLSIVMFLFILILAAGCALIPDVPPDPTYIATPAPALAASSTPTDALVFHTPSSATILTAAPAEQVPAGDTRLTPAVTTTCGLKVEDYTLGSAKDLDLPANTDFAAQLPPALFDKQRAAQESATPTITQTNQTLEAFGYRLVDEPGTGIALYQGDQRIKEGLSGFGPVSLSQSGEDFAMVAGAWDNAWLVTKGSIEKWDPSAHFQQTPRFLGDELLTLNWKEVDPVSGAMGAVVERSGQPISKQALPYTGAEGCPVAAFDAWNGQWALETEKDIFLDGESLSQKMGYQQAFDLALLQGKPFYVFQKDGVYGMTYGDKILPVQFDEVIHPNCITKKGAGVPYGDGAVPDLVWFFARSGGNWHFIQVSPKPG